MQGAATNTATPSAASTVKALYDAALYLLVVDRRSRDFRLFLVFVYNLILDIGGCFSAVSLVRG
jgi:hypothetical protein